MARRRSHGSGSVFYDHGARSWVGLLSLGTRGGKRFRRKVRGKTELEARQKLEGLQRIYRVANPSFETLDEYLHRWLTEHAVSVREPTERSYRGHIERHIAPLLGDIRLGLLTTADVRRLVADRTAAGLSAATVIRIVTTLRIALNQAVKDRSISDNPAAGVKLPKIRRDPIRALTAEHVRRLRSAIIGDEFEAAYVLLMGTGMRAGEACGLDWQDVDLEAGTAFISQGKTARSIRTVHLAPQVVMALRAHRARSARIAPTGPVFIGPRSGKRLRPSTLSHAFPRILERAGLPRMRVHDLRHGYATRALSMGANVRTVADNLGHSRASFTLDMYAHAVPDDQRIASDLVGSELA